MGTGVGFLASRFAEAGCRVAGIDIAAGQVDEARRLAEERGLSIDWRVGAAEDVDLGGQKIAKGESVMLLFASGARDESSMEHPEKFDITRNNSRNMAFGFGAHSCLGRYLAKLEMEAFFSELLPRLKSVELNGEPSYMASNMVTGPKTMPIHFEFH